jgi:tetratricopeptide (TPR) repeat protein
MKTCFLLPVALLFLFPLVAVAQSIQEGKQLLYYEKFVSAKSHFEKMLAKQPSNAEAAYWLGQAHLLNDDENGHAAAQRVYEQALAQNPNDPLLLAGKGHLLLADENLAEARLSFETALNLSQSKNAAVLNAIGVANTKEKEGNLAYAIAQLEAATKLKGMKDPDIWCNLGDAHRKNFDGSNAQQAYKAALDLQPKYARAFLRTGEIFLTYGRGYENIYMKWFDDALAKDPAYAPVYKRLYKYYYDVDVIKSGEYLDKYLNIMGADEPNACYYKTSMTYVQGNFDETLQRADDCIKAAGENPFPKLYGLKAYAYSRKNDSTQAVKAFEAYFAKSEKDKLQPGDYATYIENVLKVGGGDALVTKLVNDGLESDSTEAGKSIILAKVISHYTAKQQYAELARWYAKLVDIKKMPKKLDLYNMAYTYSKAGNLQAAADGWDKYARYFPDEMMGYDMKAKTLWNIDSTMEQGLANAAFEQVITLGEKLWATDSVKVKNNLVRAYKYFIAYSYNIEKNKEKAILYCDKVLSKDPTDAEALANREALLTMKPQPTPAPTPKKKN